MFAKLKHLAIVSDQYTLLGRFYEALFGMKPSPDNYAAGAIVVSDGPTRPPSPSSSWQPRHGSCVRKSARALPS